MSTKFTFILVAILFLFGISSMGLSYYIIKESNLKDMDKSLHDTSLVLAQFIDKNMVKSILKQPNADNPDVLQSTKEMDEIINRSGSVVNMNLVSLVDGRLYAPSLSSSILESGAEYNLDLEQAGLSPEYLARSKEAMDKQVVMATEIYGDKFGMYKTGFAPILDDNGGVLAAIAVDYDVSKVTAKAWSEAMKIFYVTIAILLIAGTGMYIVVRRKFAPIQALTTNSKRVAEGDLEVELLETKSNDEMGLLITNYNLMIDNLKHIITSVKKVSEHVAGSSHILSSNMNEVMNSNHHIVATMQEIASGAEAQVERADQSSRIFEEMGIAIQRMAESASAISQSSTTTTHDAEKGNQSTQRAVKQMNQISQIVNQSASLVKVLGQRSEEIGNIVGIIAGIASQTNLLALNAAIEAARAGEYGRGFAVVADEVRKLAEQSEDSTRQISNIITQIQNDTMDSVKMMDHAVKEVGDGMEIVHEAEMAFGQISQSIRHIAEQIQEVSATFEEMSAATEDVTNSVQQMDTISKNSRDNTKAVAEASISQMDTIEEISSQAQSLKELSEELQMIIKNFRIK